MTARKLVRSTTVSRLLDHRLLDHRLLDHRLLDHRLPPRAGNE